MPDVEGMPAFKEKRHGTYRIGRRFEHDCRRVAGIGITA